jgi:hypothetical protein
MAIRKRGKGRWQVRVRPFPEVTVPTKEAAETLELDLRLRAKLGHLYREKPTSLGDELDGLLQRKTTMGGKRGQLRPAGIRYYQECVRPWGPLRNTPIPALRRRQVEDHVAARAAVAPTAARNELQVLKAALRAAQSRGQQVDVGILEIDPVRIETRESVALEYSQLLDLASWLPERIKRIVPFWDGRPALHRGGHSDRRPRRPRGGDDLHPRAAQQEQAAEADLACAHRGPAAPRAVARATNRNTPGVPERERRHLLEERLPGRLATCALRRRACP